MICFRLLDSDNPAEPLAQAVAKVCEGENPSDVYSVNPTSFRQVPNAPFAYWVSENIRGLFAKLPAFEGDGRTAKQGLITGFDFRFVRASWETPADKSNLNWFPFAKGGSYSPFFADVHLMVNWGAEGSELCYLGDPSGLRPDSRPQNTDYYFRPGLMWPRRTQSGLALRILPRGCIFSDKGPSVFDRDNTSENLLKILAISTGTTFRGLVEIQMAFGSYEVGVIQRTVVPSLDEQSTKALGDSAHSAWSTKRNTDTANQTSHAFYAPALTPRRTKPLSTHSS